MFKRLPWPSTGRLFYIYLGIVILLCFFIRIHAIPQIFKANLVNDPAVLGTTMVLLNDDIMITMRAAKQVLIHGFPTFNKHDLAQPSSSYLLPFVAALTFHLIPYDGLALLLIMLMGVFCFYLACLISTNDFSLKSKILFCAILLFNSTSYGYLFSGWEQLYQSLFIVLAWACVFSGNKGALTYLLIGLFSAVAILFRADAIFLLIPIYLYYLYRKQYKSLLLACVPLAIIGCTYTYFQYSWFNTLLPTTARLKTGELTAISYSVKYVVKLFLSGSALVLIIALLFFFRNDLKKRVDLIFCSLGVVANCLYAVMVSDVFSYGRMFMAAFFVMVLMISKLDPVLIEKKISDPRFYHTVALVLFMAIAVMIIKPSKIGQIVSFKKDISPTVEQYILAEDIKNALSPKDGAIGLFYAGSAAFNLIDYDIADFLGKADEAIATTKAKRNIKWKAPGHNKWDFETSFSKWNIVVVPMSGTLIAEVDRTGLGSTVILKNAYNFFELVVLHLKDKAYTLFNRLGLTSTTKLERHFLEAIIVYLKGRDYTFCKPIEYFDHGLYIRDDVLHKFHQCNQDNQDPTVQTIP